MFAAEPSFIDGRVGIRPSLAHGKGMFAKAPIHAGEVVYRWGGTFVTSAELLTMDASRMVVVQVDDDLWSVEDRGRPEDDTYFINHSCDGNLWMVDGRTFVARREIADGEEITVDYALFVSEDYVSKWSCACGSLLCRKSVTGRDYLREDVRGRYAGHFSPVILKKMRNGQ